MNYSRILSLSTLLKQKSFFLFGARSTGKTSLIQAQLGDQCCYIDLLRSEYLLRLSQNPEQLESIILQAKKEIVVIDEVQKLPNLLDEVQRLSKDYRFLLTGSSARSLKRGHGNMLGGRAWEARLFPLVSSEIPKLDLSRYLRYGGLPHVYSSGNPGEELSAYVSLYLREEVMAEGIIRDLPRFSRLLKVAALSSARLINFTKLASEVGAAPSTVIEHFRILEDTLIGFFIEPWGRSKKRKEVARGKFFLFDTGVTHALAGTQTLDRNSDLFGRSLEQFIAMELRAYLSYRRLPFELNFWTTHSGLEVDFVIDRHLALEVKATSNVQDADLRGLRALSEEEDFQKRILVSLDPISRSIDGMNLMPVETFLSELWKGGLISG